MKSEYKEQTPRHAGCIVYGLVGCYLGSHYHFGSSVENGLRGQW